MAANSAQVLLLAARLKLKPRQIRCILASVTAVRDMEAKYMPNDDYKMRASDILLATEGVESNYTIYANGNNPESMRHYHEAVGWDHGSVGPIQQQPGGAPYSTANWGTTAQCMDPDYSSRHFVRVLVTKTHNGLSWLHLSNGVAAQMVQGSAFPDRYAQRDSQAIKIRQAVWKYCEPGRPSPKPKPVKPAPKKPKIIKVSHNKIVTVKSGDSMASIAKKNGVSTQALIKANPKAGHPAGNENVIWPKDRLRIP